jgi:hypothetical protein
MNGFSVCCDNAVEIREREASLISGPTADDGSPTGPRGSFSICSLRAL